jgi:hypothetical protein
MRGGARGLRWRCLDFELGVECACGTGALLVLKDICVCYENRNYCFSVPPFCKQTRLQTSRHATKLCFHQ